MERKFSFYALFFSENLKFPSLFWQLTTTFWQQKCPAEAARRLPTNLVFNPENKDELAQLLKELQILKHLEVNEFLTILNQSGNEVLADLLSVDPDDTRVRIGSLAWEKIIYDLWEDLSTNVNFESLAEVFTQANIISGSEVKVICKNAGSNEQRIARLMCLIAERTSSLEVLRKALYFIGTTDRRCVDVANKCIPWDPEQFEWIQHHRDMFILRVENILEAAKILRGKFILNDADLVRLHRQSSLKERAKLVINTIQRRHGDGMNALINACCQTGNDDLAIVMSLRPNEIALSWDSFQLLQLGWKKMVDNINYDAIMSYLISRNFLLYKEHLQLLSKGNREKMREILKMALTKPEFYEAFFHILSLQRNYRDIVKSYYPMDFDEQKVLLEVQDFIAMNMENVDAVCDRLADFELLTPSDQEYIGKMDTPLKKKMTIVNILKTKGGRTVRRFLDVLWSTYNRDCAEILAVDCRDFKMAHEEWMKLKLNWSKIVKRVSWDLVSSTLFSTGIIDKKEMQWIDKSQKNRQKMRKLLRILPTKERGYRILLLAMSQFDEFHSLLLDCQPMHAWLCRRIQASEEFLVENTSKANFSELLNQLVERKCIKDVEKEMITLYEDPIFELYNLLRGKSNEVIEDLIKSLQMTGNFDAAGILNVDLFAVKMTSVEWQDYQRIWLDCIETVNYQNCRQYFVSSGLISTIEDEYICTEPDNERQMRLLLQILPYRHDSLQGLVQMMML